MHECPQRLLGVLRGVVLRGGHQQPDSLPARIGDDERPIVGKGASWALRQIGKRNPGLRECAVEVAEALRDGGPGARWVGADALRELRRPQ